MSDILLNELRHGNITSSEAVSLVSYGTRDMTDFELEEHKKLFPKSKKTKTECWPGKAAATYIEERNMERRLGRSLDNDIDAKACSWGEFMEIVLARLLHGHYDFTKTTVQHKTIPCWVGTPDGFKLNVPRKTLFEQKSPYTMKSFCKLVDPIYDGLEGLDAINAIRNGYKDSKGLEHSEHKDGDKFYYQKVSNGCITEADVAELIVYCPFESEIPVIQHAAMELADPKFEWIHYAKPESLPYLKDGGKYNNINIIQFEIPKADKELLTDLVLKASTYLI